MKRNYGYVLSMHTNFGKWLLAIAVLLLVTCAGARRVESAQAKTESLLAQLAKSRFSNLSECEMNLLRNAPLGSPAFCGPTHSLADQVPDDSAAPGQRYDIRAHLIRWLCIDSAAAKLVDPVGLWVDAARVVGQLDVRFATVPFPLVFRNSRFLKNIALDDSHWLIFPWQVVARAASRLTA